MPPVVSFAPDAVRATGSKRPRWHGLVQHLDETYYDDMWRFMGFEPHALQRQVIIDPHRHKVLCCGRRWGKSLGCSSVALSVAAMGGWVWVVAPTFDLADVIFEDCVTMAEGSDYVSLLEGVPRMQSGRQRLKTVTGGRIYAKSSERPKSLLGRGLDLIIFDEASKEPNSLIYPQYLSPTLSDRGGSSIVISTPTGNDWFRDRWLAGQEGRLRDTDIISWRYPSRTNPHFRMAEWHSQKTRLPERVFRQEYEAEFLDDAGGVFRGFSKLATLKMLPEPVPGSGRYVMGVDLAKYHDWTVIIVMDAVTRKMVWFDRFNQIDWAIQRERILQASRRWSCPIMLDSTGVGDPIVEELSNSGHMYGVYGFKFSNITKAQVINQLAIAIEQGDIELINEPLLLDELASYQYTKTAAGNLTMNAPQGKTDDMVIALALAVEMCHRYGGQGLPQLVERKR